MAPRKLQVGGVCNKGHRLTEENVRMEGDRVRCRTCTGTLRPRIKLELGGVCGYGHRLTEDNIYRYPEGSAYPGKIVCKQCRIRSVRKHQGYSGELDAPVGRWRGDPDKPCCANGHEYTEATTYHDPKTGYKMCKLCIAVQGFIARAKKYGLTPEQLQEMIDEQEDHCAICGEEDDSLAIDHCHVTGIVRKLLCDNCNNMLGRAHDNPAVLRAGADYLEKHLPGGLL